MARFGSILPRVTSSPSASSSAAEARRQRIVLGHGQQHDTRPRDRPGPGEARATARPDLRERRRAAPARPAPCDSGRTGRRQSRERRPLPAGACVGGSGPFEGPDRSVAADVAGLWGERSVGEQVQVEIGGVACSRIVTCFEPRLQHKTGGLARERGLAGNVSRSSRTSCPPRRSPCADRRRSCPRPYVAAAADSGKRRAAW